MDQKYEHIHMNQSSLPCPACGAVNAAGSLNCAYCGRTLVTVEKTEVEESVMNEEDFVNAARNMARNSRAFLKDFAEEVNKINETRNPNYDREAGREENKKKLIIAVSVVAAVIFIGGFGMILLFNIGSGLFMNGLMRGIQNADANVARSSDHAVGKAIFDLVLLGIMAVISVVGMTVFKQLFRKKKTTKTIYGMQCKSCGANNPAGSSICSYCGASMTETDSRTESPAGMVGEMVGEAVEEAANGIKGIITDAINKEYDYRDKK